MYWQQMQHNLTFKESGHLHILYAGQWKFVRASRILHWSSSLEMLLLTSTPGFVLI